MVSPTLLTEKIYAFLDYNTPPDGGLNSFLEEISQLACAEAGLCYLSLELIADIALDENVIFTYPQDKSACNCADAQELILPPTRGDLSRYRLIYQGSIASEHLQALGRVINSRLKIFNSEAMINRVNDFVESTRIIGSALEMDILTPIIMEQLKENIGLEASSLLLLNPDTNQLEFSVATGKKAYEIKKYTLNMGEGIAGWVAENRKTVVVNDASSDDRFSPRLDSGTNFETKNIICVPLIVRDTVVGVIQGINKLHGANFDTSDQQLIELLSFNIGVAIENARLFTSHRELFVQTITALTTAMEMHHTVVAGHSRRVMFYSLAIFNELDDVDDSMRYDLQIAATLHDVGNIATNTFEPDDGLGESDLLTIEKMEHHVLAGIKILEGITLLKEVVPIIRHHHELYDGSGYPDALAEEKIPLLARIIAIADYLDILTAPRPNQKAVYTLAEAIEVVAVGAGTLFDPVLTVAAENAVKRGYLTIKEFS